MGVYLPQFLKRLIFMKISPPKLLLDAKADLGEGPAWDSARNLLYWVDIRVGHLHVYNPKSGQDESCELGQLLGCVAPTKSGKLICGLKDSLATLDLSSLKPSDSPSAHLTVIAQPELHLPGNRFNDGKCGPDGRFLAGTMDNAEVDATGSLYSLGSGGNLKTLLTGIRISNGLAWSADYQTLYFIDTPTRKVMAYDYDLQTGEIARPRVALTVPEEFGWPDGMTSDTQGRLWIAMWGGAKITVWDAEKGQLVESIPIPAKNVTSCAFGGSERNQLYVTSARKGLDSAALTEYPATGGLFCLETNVEGLPTFQFND
jgi:sugar lactone lactonase YvrE